MRNAERTGRQRFLFLAELCFLAALTVPRSLIEPVTAATRTDRMLVTATVVAECTIALTPSLLAKFAGADAPAQIPCGSADGVPEIIASPPISFISRIGATQQRILTLEF